jgi:hypothetical protein
LRSHKNPLFAHLPTPDERALYIRSSIQGIQRIIGECFAKYEEDGNLDSLKLAFDGHVQLIEILKQVKEQYSYGHEYDFGK